jgi:hypothetical protein
MTTNDRKKWEARGVEYDDQAVPDNEAPRYVPPVTRRRQRQWLRDTGGPDHLHCRWTPWGQGERGWLTVTDPFTGEDWDVPTKYADGAPWSRVSGGVPAPQWMVRRAMEKLPPREPQRERGSR